VPPPPLIPRETLFGNPERIAPRVSPDGRRLLYVAPRDGVLNVWVRSIEGGDDRPVTGDGRRGIMHAGWTPDGSRIFYLQDRDGDENWHIYDVPADGGPARDLTPFPGVSAFPIATHPDFPHALLAAINARDRRHHDVHRLDLSSGRQALELTNDFAGSTFTPDNTMRIRVTRVPRGDGGSEFRHRAGGEGAWKGLLEAEADDTVFPVGFDGDNRTLWLASSVGADTAQLRALDVESGAERVAAADPSADVADVFTETHTDRPRAVGFLKDRLVWRVLDDRVAPDFEALRAHHAGDFRVTSVDNADRLWVASWSHDRGSDAWGLWDRSERRVRPLFAARPALDALPLAPMEPVTFAARDGLAIHGYLTLPPGAGDGPFPAVLLVHGGPWVRDVWRCHPEVQWLANRGYAVLQPNYRGSMGYGKAFLRAAFKEWGGKMQDDLTDAVAWMVERRIADPKRVAIMGGSYGGYAALSGMTKTPEIYACGVAMCGPSNLFTFFNTIPPYWESFRSSMRRRVGDPETEPELIRARSPLFHIERIRGPLLIAQGANDPRVAKAESLQIVEAMRAAGKEVEYLEFADEGHGLVRPANRLRFYGAAERFLARHLGGSCEAT
jgi:dipeptidyl aminopeptidase/acylaminoacyl peptidase